MPFQSKTRHMPRSHPHLPTPPHTYPHVQGEALPETDVSDALRNKAYAKITPRSINMPRQSGPSSSGIAGGGNVGGGGSGGGILATAVTRLASSPSSQFTKSASFSVGGIRADELQRSLRERATEDGAAAAGGGRFSNFFKK